MEANTVLVFETNHRQLEVASHRAYYFLQAQTQEYIAFLFGQQPTS